MNNSFYGGRDGHPMIIKKTFPTVQEMLSEFSDPKKLTVNFGEYALIQTVNRKNPENGMLFRRSYDYNNQTGNKVLRWQDLESPGNFTSEEVLANGAIEVGRISGPGGDAPHLHFVDENGIADLIEEIKNNFEYIQGAGELTVENGNLVSGRDQDKITYKWCSIRDINGYDTDAYLGFTVPALAIDVKVNQISPRENTSIDVEKHHNFYETWTLNIPKGMKGESIEKLEVVPETQYYDELQIIEDDGDLIPYKTIFVEDEKTPSETKLLLVAHTCHYREEDTGTRNIVYLSDYKTVRTLKYHAGTIIEGTNGEVDPDDQFSIQVEYSDDTKETVAIVEPLEVGKSVGVGPDDKIDPELRINGIWFSLDEWNPDNTNKEIILADGSTLKVLSEADLEKILID